MHFDNLASATNNPDIVFSLLAKEINVGRISGPYPEPPHSMRVNPIGIVNKSHDETLAQRLVQYGPCSSLDENLEIMTHIEGQLRPDMEYRLIFYLSAHDKWGKSVNSTTAEEYKGTSYPSFDDVNQM